MDANTKQAWVYFCGVGEGTWSSAALLGISVSLIFCLCVLDSASVECMMFSVLPLWVIACFLKREGMELGVGQDLGEEKLD